MTDIAEDIEKEYQNQMKNVPTRKSGMIKWGVFSAVSYIATASLIKAFPEYFPGFENVDMVEYAKMVAIGFPIFVGTSVAVGALTPEIHKLASWMVYKPIKLVGKGIDYISNGHK